MLSAEQLKRIEENRHKAKEKLASRKQQQTVSHEKTISSAQTGSQRQVSVSTAHSRVPSHITAVCSGEIGRSTNRNVHPKTLEFHTSSTSVTAANKSSHAQQPPAISSNTVKYTQLVKKTVKANLTLVSKQRFEIVVPYDKLAIEVFKKTPSNAYSKTPFLYRYLKVIGLIFQQMLKQLPGLLELKPTTNLVIVFNLARHIQHSMHCICILKMSSCFACFFSYSSAEGVSAH